MSSETEAMAQPVSPAAAPRAAAYPWTRTFEWSVRRELWENKSVWIAPLAVAGVVVLGFLLGSAHLAEVVAKAAAPTLSAAAPAESAAALKAHLHAISELKIPYFAAAAAPALTGIVVAVFYCLSALNGERRDRSLLFWKSLPVSDIITVAAKAFVPLVVVPVATVAVVFAAQLILVLYSTAVLAVNGVDPGLLWNHLPTTIWVMLPYGLALNALWYAPIYGWLLLVSAFAKRLTFVWALAVPLGLALFEFVTLHTHRVWSLLDDRINTGFAEAFSVDGLGKRPIESLSQVDPGRFFALPGLWGGLVFFAAAFVACVWLRRRHDPV